MRNPSFRLHIGDKLPKLLLLILLLPFSTGCSNQNNMATPESSVTSTSETRIAPEDNQMSASPEESTPVVEKTPSPSNSPSKSSNTSPKTQTSQSPLPIKSSNKPNAKPSAKKSATKIAKPSDAELREKYPPVIGSTVPWYEPTVETVAKAYTSAKPMAWGNNYALVLDGNTLTLVYLVGVKDGVGYWKSQIYIFKTKEELAAQYRVDQNIIDATGLNAGQLVFWDEELGAWCIMSTFDLARPEQRAYGVQNQRWLAPQIIK